MVHIDKDEFTYDKHPYGHPLQGQKIRRPSGAPTPCQVCPKCRMFKEELPSPQVGRRCDLSLKNKLTLQLYHIVKVVGIEKVEHDHLTLMNFGHIQRTYETFTRQMLLTTAMTPKLSLI